MTSSTSNRLFQAVIDTKTKLLLTVSVPALFEARCFWAAQRDCNNFVLAAEGALIDAGIILNNDPSTGPFEDYTARLYNTIEKSRGQNVVLTLDMKCINPTACKDLPDTFYEYSISMKAYQLSFCDFFVVFNPAAPNLVAIVPRSLVRNGHADVKHTAFSSRPILMTEGPVEPFPMEISGCVMPFSYFSAALRECQSLHTNNKHEWRNPYTHLVICGLPQPQLQTVESLQTHPDSFLQDLLLEKWLWEAFRDYSRDWDCVPLIVRPGVADMQFVRREERTNQSRCRLVVEIKTSQVRIRQDGTVRHLTRKWHATVLKPKYFSYDLQADFILTINETESYGLFLPLRQVPREWFHSEEELVSWKPGDDFLKRHRVPFEKDHPNLFVKATEQVLDHYAQTQIPGNINWSFARPGPRETDYLLNSRESRSTTKGDTSEESLSVEEHGGVSQILFKTKIERMLKQQCSIRRCGWVYTFGIHPRSSFMYVPLDWDADAGPPSFAEFAPQTPLLYLNFAQIDNADEEEFRSRYDVQFLQATHGTGSSLYVLLPSSMNLRGMDLDCYILPSPTLNGDGMLVRRNQRWLDSETLSRDRRIRLLEDEPLLTYRRKESEIVAFIDRLCGQLPDLLGSPSSIFDGLPLFKSTYLDGILGSKLEAMQDGINMAGGHTLWKHKIRVRPGISCRLEENLH